VLILSINLIDRVGRRRLLLIGAIGMAACEFIVAIVGVTAGNVDPVTQAVTNLAAQKVLVVFVCMFVFFS
jgi:SP family sugar:H+ symporter-like MFS transporter